MFSSNKNVVGNRPQGLHHLNLGRDDLIRCGLVTSYCDIGLGQHWLRRWLTAWRNQAITWTNLTQDDWHPSPCNFTKFATCVAKTSFKIFWRFVCICQGTMSWNAGEFRKDRIQFYEEEWSAGGCFTNVSRALQNILSNLYITKIVFLMRISSWNLQSFSLKFSA